MVCLIIMRQSEKGFSDVVKEWWDSIYIRRWMGYQLAQKLKFLKNKKKQCKKEVFGSIMEREPLVG